MKKIFLFTLAGLAAVVVSLYAANALRANAVTEPIPDPCTAENGTGCGGDFTPNLTPNPVTYRGTITVSGTATGQIFSAAAGGLGSCGNYVTTAPTLNAPVDWTVAGPSINGTVGGTVALTTTSVGSDGGGTTCNAPPGPGNGSPGGSWGTPYEYSFNFSLNTQNYSLNPGDYTLTFSTTDSMGHVINSAPIPFTVSSVTGSPQPGSISVSSISPNPATNQITVSGNATGPIVEGQSKQYCTGPGGGPVGDYNYLPILPAPLGSSTYSIDGDAPTSFALNEEQSGVVVPCPGIGQPQNIQPYTYSFSFLDNAGISALSNGPHSLQVCAAETSSALPVCDTDSFSVQNTGSAILQLSSHSVNFSSSGPNSQSIQVTNAGPAGSQLSWSATVPTGGSWLSVGPSSNPAQMNSGDSETVNISINPAALSPGTNIGTVTFAGASVVDGKTLSPQSVTVSAIGAGSPPAGTITVASQNSQTQQPVTASWAFIAGPAAPSSSNVAEATYTNMPFGGYILCDSFPQCPSTTQSDLAFNSIQSVPFAGGHPLSWFYALGSFTKNIISPNAMAGSISPAPSLSLSSSLLTNNYIILWNPVAVMSLSQNTWSPTAPTAGSATTQQIAVSNSSAQQGSNLTWTATSDSSWLTVAPSSDSSGLATGASDTVTVTADPSSLAPSATPYTGHVKFTGISTVDGSSETQILTVSFSVTNAGGAGFNCVSNACVQVPSGAQYGTVGQCDTACGFSGSISGVTVSCVPASVYVNGTSTCTATVNGSGGYSSGVTWSTNNGTIDGAGNYTAPGTTGTATITATSKQDPTKSGQTPINITGAPLPTCNNASCQATCTSPTLGASPSSIVVPESSGLSYGCTNVTQCTLSGGDVNVTNPVIPLASPGSISGGATTTPSITTTYVLKCVNGSYSSDSTSTTVQVTVGGSSLCEQNPYGTGCSGQ